MMAGIEIIRLSYSPAVAYVSFPNGDVWAYAIYENRRMDDIIKHNRRNMGRVVALFKKWAYDSYKVDPKTLRPLD